jgi:TetR/AcrR family transcriptional repressor of bet genes
MVDGYAQASTPRDRLLAVMDANFSDTLYAVEKCSIWMQFWANAPYSNRLSRLHRINRARVRSHFMAELSRLVPAAQVETARHALQSYMDGVWLEAAQSEADLNPEQARLEARRVARILLDSPTD